MNETLLARLAKEFNFREKYLLRLIRSAPFRYKVYRIEKRQEGKYRTIAQPAVEAKMLQYFIINNYLVNLPVHPSATGYVRKQNIKSNASLHARNQFLLKMDFVDFFPSIKPDDLFTYLAKTKENTLRKDDFPLVRDILFWCPKWSKTGDLELSIGAPSSPLVSNLVMFEFDKKMNRLCKGLNIAYSRYADDLTFSTNERHILESVHKRIEKICEQWKHPTLRINREKTVFSSKKHRRRITGLIITNKSEISLGRDRKRLVRESWYNEFRQ